MLYKTEVKITPSMYESHVGINHQDAPRDPGCHRLYYYLAGCLFSLAID